LEFLPTGHIVDIIKEVVCYLLMDATNLGPQMFLDIQKKRLWQIKKIKVLRSLSKNMNNGYLVKYSQSIDQNVLREIKKDCKTKH
jgi:hypothetical protein